MGEKFVALPGTGLIIANFGWNV